MLLGWRTHDIDAAYVPFLHGVGAQTGFSDPVFMARHGEPLISDDEIPEFPYDFKEIDRKIKAGDQKLIRNMRLGGEWIAESTPGYFRDWEDLKFLRQHWDGPIVLKGIQSPEVRNAPASEATNSSDDCLMYRMRSWRLNTGWRALSFPTTVRSQLQHRNYQADKPFTLQEGGK